MADDWTATIAAERMEVDQEFRERIEDSSFTRQQWGLVMTALEFEIENPGDPSQARLVADTEKLPSIMPELDNIEQRGPPGAGGGSGGSGGSGGGLVSGLLSALGLGGGGDDDRLEEAEEMAADYADRLQETLESKGRWQTVCERAA